MFPHQYPRMACVARAPCKVRSPSDNVPNWAATVRSKPSERITRFRARVGDMARLIKGAQAPSMSDRPTDPDRSKAAASVSGGAARLWASNVPTREPHGCRCIAPAYVPLCRIRRTWKPHHSARCNVRAGLTARRAVGGVGLRCWKKPTPRCNAGDRGWKTIPPSNLGVPTSPWDMRAHVQPVSPCDTILSNLLKRERR